MQNQWKSMKNQWKSMNPKIANMISSKFQNASRKITFSDPILIIFEALESIWRQLSGTSGSSKKDLRTVKLRGKT